MAPVSGHCGGIGDGVGLLPVNRWLQVRARAGAAHRFRPGWMVEPVTVRLWEVMDTSVSMVDNINVCVYFYAIKSLKPSIIYVYFFMYRIDVWCIKLLVYIYNLLLIFTSAEVWRRKMWDWLRLIFPKNFIYNRLISNWVLNGGILCWRFFSYHKRYITVLNIDLVRLYFIRLKTFIKKVRIIYLIICWNDNYNLG